MTTTPDVEEMPDPALPSSRARMNRLALTALISGVIGLVVFAIGLAIAALVQVRRRDERGRGLAFVALAVSGCWLAAAAILLVSTRGDESDPAPEAQGPLASALKQGDCFTEFRQAGTRTFARAVPCTSSHQGEVAGTVDLPILDYPGDRKLITEGEKACRVQASTLYAAGRGDEFTLFVDRPDKEAWEHDVRTVTCLLHYSGGPKNFRLEGQWTPINLLAAGDCIQTWSDTGTVNVVDCTGKHQAQVFAKLDLEDEKRPNEAMIYAFCAKQAQLTLGPNPPAYLLRLGGPNKREWVSGQRYALCLAVSKGAPMTHSLIPG